MALFLEMSFGFPFLATYDWNTILDQIRLWADIHVNGNTFFGQNSYQVACLPLFSLAH